MSVHLRSGLVPITAACGAAIGSLLMDTVDEIHYVTCEACKKLFHEATAAGRATRAADKLAISKAVALETARAWLSQIEDLQEQAREKLASAASLPPEMAKLFDDLEKSAYALLRYLQEFQP